MPGFLDLLYDEAPLADFDRHLAAAERDLDPAAAAEVRADYDVASARLAFERSSEFFRNHLG